MSSIYDSINTPAELVREVMCHGFSTKQDDICRAQDIIGRAPIEDLVFLANDIGRDNEKGEPDPKGTMSSGRRATRGTFYMILSSIWNWEEVTRFWNQYTNPEHEKYQEMLTAYDVLKKHSDSVHNELEQEHDLRLVETSAKLAAEKEVRRLESELHDRDMEIMELKAKLYDMMMKAAG